MMTRDDDAGLDTYFAQVRDGRVPVSDALMDRIMMDADQVLAGAVPPAVPVPEQPFARPSFGAVVLDAIGGWPSFGGLAAATVAGVWIGVQPPDVLATISDALTGGTFDVPIFDSTLLSALEG